MPTYISLIRFTQKGVETIREGPKRLDMAKQAFRDAGAELKAFYLVTEQYDAVAISEVPNDETVAKLSLRTAALDNVRTETLRAFNEDEYRKIVASIGQIRWRPPRGRPSRCGPMLMWSPRLRPTSRQRPSRARSPSQACLRRLLRPRSDDRDELATSLLNESGRAAFPLRCQGCSRSRQ